MAKARWKIVVGWFYKLKGSIRTKPRVQSVYQESVVHIIKSARIFRIDIRKLKSVLNSIELIELILQNISYFPKELLENSSFKNIIGFNKDSKLNYLAHMKNLEKFKNKRVQFESVSSKIIESNLLKYLTYYMFRSTVELNSKRSLEIKMKKSVGSNPMNWVSELFKPIKILKMTSFKSFLWLFSHFRNFSEYTLS